MSTVRNVIEVDSEKVDLKSRSLAAFLAWLIPGAGHYYQGRTIKAGLFFVCIMSTWLLGFALGGFNVVYASWQPGDRRWQYPLQAGVGLAAMPAGNGNIRTSTSRGAHGNAGVSMAKR